MTSIGWAKQSWLLNFLKNNEKLYHILGKGNQTVAFITNTSTVSLG